MIKLNKKYFIYNEKTNEIGMFRVTKMGGYDYPEGFLIQEEYEFLKKLSSSTERPIELPVHCIILD